MRLQHLKTWLGLYPYSPGGFIDTLDERAINGATARSLDVERQKYAYYAALFVDKGDETFCPNPRFNVNAVVEGQSQHAYNYHANVDEGPMQLWGPSMAQLSHALYQNLADLWQELRSSNATGDWGQQ